jgi:hypothetical protein
MAHDHSRVIATGQSSACKIFRHGRFLTPLFLPSNTATNYPFLTPQKINSESGRPFSEVVQNRGVRIR